MMLKWINCRTAPETREEFARAQRAWSAIASVPGFLGQFGGFTGSDAQIFGLWRDEPSHAAFMRTEHDAVAEANRQSDSYQSIEVRCFTRRLEMPGSIQDMTRALGEARFLRVADCTVREARIERFVSVQRDVWLPGMANVPGMLAGAFWSLAGQGSRFLVTTLWSGEQAHASYVSERLPGLREQARPAEDLVGLVGYGLPLLPEWTVPPRPPRLC